MIGLAAVALAAVLFAVWSLGMARSRSLLAACVFEAEKRGFDRGWSNCREAVKDQVEAAKTVAETALASANAARAATVQRAEMVELLIENRGVGRALKEGFADIAARVDLMDADVRTIYSGFVDAKIVRARNDPDRGRQHGEHQDPLADRPPPLPPPPGEPRQN